MYRQGDLLFVREDSVPEWMRRNGKTADGVIKLGEATGHAHKLVDGDLYQRQFIESKGGARVVHEEHDTIELPEGVYRVIRQREFGEQGDATVTD